MKYIETLREGERIQEVYLCKQKTSAMTKTGKEYENVILQDKTGYLDAKKTLTVENMDEIFSMMDDAKRVNYDKEYIEELYIQYMATGQVQESHLAELRERIIGKKVLIIAPGKSSLEEKDKIIDCANQNDVITISVNFDYTEYNTDFIFLSNLRRFRELKEEKRKKH